MALPHCRDLRRGNSGQDVRAAKRAVSRWDPKVYPWIPESEGGFTRYFGGKLETAVKTFQRRHGLTVSGRITKTTQTRLEAQRNAHGDPVYDAVAARLLIDFCRDYAANQTRLAVLAAGFYLYEHRFEPIRYSQARPFLRRSPPWGSWVPSRLDCSAYVTDCYEGGRAPNPNGRPWDGLGYTGTLVANGRKIPVAELRIADLVFYGFTTRSSPAFPYGSPTHVALYVGTVGGVRSVLSHGSYPMRLLPLTYREINQCRSYLP